MAIVNFFEKPGCVNNAKQKALLREAGHTVVERNLLAEAWTEALLRPFFGELAVGSWFNRSAPAVRNGEVIPDALGEQEALELLCAAPLLIRRPLMEANGQRRCGFDFDQVHAWLGLVAEERKAGLETCPKLAKAGSPECP